MLGVVISMVVSTGLALVPPAISVATTVAMTVLTSVTSVTIQTARFGYNYIHGQRIPPSSSSLGAEAEAGSEPQ